MCHKASSHSTIEGGLCMLLAIRFMKTTSTSRRTFLKRTAAASAIASIGFPAIQGADSPGERLFAGVMGLGRGLDHINALLQIPNVEIAYISDIDEERIAKAAKVVGGK